MFHYSLFSSICYRMGSSTSKQNGFTNAAQTCTFDFKTKDDEELDCIVITEIDDWELPHFVDGKEVDVQDGEEGEEVG